MSDGQQQAKTGVTSTGVEAKKKSEPMLYFHPGSATLLCVDATGNKALEQEHNFLTDLLQKQMLAQRNLDDANYAALSLANTQPRKAEKDLEAAYAALNEANKKLREELKTLTDYVPQGEMLDEKTKESAIELMELIPLKRGSTKGFKMTYVRSDKIKSHWRRYKLSEVDKKSGEASFIKYKNKKIQVNEERDGQVISVDKVVKKSKIDFHELIKQFKKVEAKYKHEWPIVEDSDTILGSWAKEMNKSLTWPREKDSTEKDEGKIDISGQAQLMRYSQGVGAEAEFNPLEKKATAKVAGHASFTLGEGKLEAAFYVPDRLGVSLLFPAKNNGVCNMGALRFAISGVFTGNVGASLGIEIGVEMDWSGEMAKGYGIKGRPAELSSAGLPGKRTMSLIDKAPKPDNKAGAEIGAFAGAQAGLNVGGAIEWYDPNPEGSVKDTGKDKVIDPKENKFTAIAKLEIGVTVQAGAGGSGVFYVTYIQSRFRIYCKASLCWGVGAKGNLGFEVDGNHFLAFMKSFMYMLRNVDYQKLSNMMARDSFAVLCSIPIIMAASGVQAVETMLRDAQDIINIIGKEIEDESKRVALMNSIIENPDQLKYTPPETKGAIIAQLIDTNWFDKNDPRNQNNNLLSLNSWKFGPLKLRKQAVFLSLKWVQSKADYNNIMQHLTPVPGQVKGDAKVNEQRVVKFLGMGEYNFPGFTNYGEKLAWLYESLPDQVAYDAPFKPIPEKRMEQYLAMLDKQHPNSTMTA